MRVPLPAAFAQRLQQQIGATEFEAYLQELEKPAPVSIRINPAKIAQQPALEKVPWSKLGYYLPTRPSFTLDPLLHAGAYYVQEASSMFLEQALLQSADVTKPLRVLDLCGAPGGKSTHLASLLSADSLLVSNEVIRSRANILAENLQKWGTANVVVTNNDPRSFGQLAGFFDVLVIDAPCSGEGLFRKDPEAINEWSEANVKLCSERQRRILADVWEALRPGGILIYSTCTFAPDENEENLNWLAQHTHCESVELQVPVEWGAVEKRAGRFYGYQFYPHKVRGEGLFMSVIKKAGNEEAAFVQKPKRSKLTPVTKQQKDQVSGWVKPAVETEIISLQPNLLTAFPQHLLSALEELLQHLYFVYAGTQLAEIIHKEVKPLPALALSQNLNKQQFTSVSVSKEQALRYLKRDDILLPDVQNGWVLICYENFALGWAKKVGNRSNNYYPKEWRIRMDVDFKMLATTDIF